jgi:hypothetical protein
MTAPVERRSLLGVIVSMLLHGMVLIAGMLWADRAGSSSSAAEAAIANRHRRRVRRPLDATG